MMAMPMNWSASASWPLWVAGIVLFQFLVSRAPTHRTTLSVAHFPLRSALHLQRKAQHALTGLLFYIAAGALAPDLAVTVLLGAAGGFYLVHELRKRSPRIDKLYLASFRGILRQDEAAKRVLPGAFYFVLGSALTLALFPLSIARLAVVHVRRQCLCYTSALYGCGAVQTAITIGSGAVFSHPHMPFDCMRSLTLAALSRRPCCVACRHALSAALCAA